MKATRNRWRREEATMRLMIEDVRGGGSGNGNVSFIGSAKIE
jgi:hypothetical protein